MYTVYTSVLTMFMDLLVSYFHLNWFLSNHKETYFYVVHATHHILSS